MKENYRKNYFAHITCRVKQLPITFLNHLIAISWNTEFNGKNALACEQMVLQT